MAPHVDRMGNFDDKDIKLLKETKGFTDEQIRQMTSEQLASAINTVKQSGANPEELPPDNSEARFKEQAKQVGILGGVMAFVGGVVGYFAGGRNAKAVAKGATLGAAAGAVISLTSCGGKDLGGTVTMNNTINAYIPINIHNHVDLNSLLHGIEDLKDQLDQIIANQEEMIHNQAQMLQNQLVIITLIERLTENQTIQHQGLIDMLGQIYTQLQTMDIHQQESTIAVLNALLELKAQNAEQYHALMAQLDAMNLNVVTGFSNTVAAILEQGGNIADNIDVLITLMQQVQTKLNEVLVAINQLGENMQAGFLGMLQAVSMNGATLEEILAMLEHIKNMVAQVNQNVTNGNHLLQQILGAIQNLDANMQAGIAQILAKLDGMDANQQAALLQMLQHMIQIEQNQNQQSEQMQTIINLIHQLQTGQNITQQKLDAILAAINNLNGNVTEQGNALALLLTQILGKLDSIDNKVDVIKTTATTMLSVVQHMDGDNHIIIGLLQQIIANQGNNYNNDCLECCQQVVILLEQIVAYIVNGGTNNEGFDGSEYDDLFS